MQKGKELDNNIEFLVTTDHSTNIAKFVEHNELDVGFIFGDIPFEGFKHHLGVNSAILVYNKPFALEDLPNMNRIEYSKDIFTTKLIDSWWHKHFIAPPRVAMVATNGDTCREMVLKGLGYAIFTVEEFISNDDRLYKLPMTNIDGSPVQRDMWLLCRKDYKKNVTLCNFINSIKDLVLKQQ